MSCTCAEMYQGDRVVCVCTCYPRQNMKSFSVGLDEPQLENATTMKPRMMGTFAYEYSHPGRANGTFINNREFMEAGAFTNRKFSYIF